MTSSNDIHLTDEQFSGLMLGDALDTGAQAHLAGCAMCRKEASIFTGSIHLFSTTSMAVVETKPVGQKLLPAFRSRQRRAVYVPVVLALAAMVLAMGGIPVVRQHYAHTAEPVVAQTVSGDSAAQIEADNQLLQSVNLVLSSNEGSSPLPESRITGHAARVAGTDSRSK